MMRSMLLKGEWLSGTLAIKLSVWLQSRKTFHPIWLDHTGVELRHSILGIQGRAQMQSQIEIILQNVWNVEWSHIWLMSVKKNKSCALNANFLDISMLNVPIKRNLQNLLKLKMMKSCVFWEKSVPWAIWIQNFLWLLMDYICLYWVIHSTFQSLHVWWWGNGRKDHEK